jgi:type VI secretion system secreted protein VgrG
MIELKVQAPWSDTVVPVRVQASEALSRCYTITVDFLSTNPDLDPRQALRQAGSVGFGVGDTRQDISGVVAEFSLMGQLPRDNYWYQLLIVPRLQLLDLTRRSRVFCTEQPANVTEVIKEVLSTAQGVAFSEDDSAVPTDADPANPTYPQLDMVVQYAETDLAFISRLAEDSGIFYYFDTRDDGEPGGGAERVVFADSNVACPMLAGVTELQFRASISSSDPGPAVRSLAIRNRVTPGQTTLNERDHVNPRTVLLVEAPADPFGLGIHQYDEEDGYRDAGWGRTLVARRLQQTACQRRVISGSSDCVTMRAGRVMTLSGHPTASVNGRYLLTSVEHRVWNPAAGVDHLPGVSVLSAAYQNTFCAIPLDVPFRPEQTTPWPSIPGLMRAEIDGSDQERADIDDLGRYRIILSFDKEQRPRGRASCPVRLITPHGGPKEGFHFPLRAGTQVMIAFLNGDPDRPVIVGPLSDGQQLSVVTKQNRYVNMLTTASGIVMKLNDGTPESS